MVKPVRELRDLEQLTILNGDCRAMLRTLPDESVHCVVTSPPYWGLRDYKLEPLVWGGKEKHSHVWKSEIGFKNSTKGNNGSTTASDPGHSASGRFDSLHGWCECGAWRGSYGLEPTIDLYLEHTLEIFREVRRVLRSDGTLWLNLGDSYSAHAGQRKPTDIAGIKQQSNVASTEAPSRCVDGLKPKDLCGMPWRVAFALQADGWWLRSDIVWAKPNPMPESVTDRPTRSHEYMFLLTKSAKYFYDAEAIKEPASAGTHGRYKTPDGWDTSNGNGGHGSVHREGREKGRKLAPGGVGIKNNHSMDAALAVMPGTRNKRSVWNITTESYSDAHFATFPSKLVEPCILAGTSAKGCCGECGAPYERIIEGVVDHSSWNGSRFDDGKNLEVHPNVGKREYRYVERGIPGEGEQRGRRPSCLSDGQPQVVTLAWSPTCKCEGEEIVPCVVLDPFGGSGTVGKVALQLARNVILIELSPEYVKLIRKRCAITPGLALAE